MKRAALAFHVLMTVGIAVITGALWFKMITEGDDAWLNWRRSFEFAGLYFDLYLFLLSNVIALPALVFCAWRLLALLGAATPRPGVRASANLCKAMVLAAVFIIAARYGDWDFLYSGKAIDRPQPPSDDKLNYPELPLPAEEAFSWELHGIDGKTLDVAELKGKAVFLNIWATWCGFCIYEFPNILRLHESFKDNPNVVFVLVSDEDPEIVRAWIEGAGKEHALPFYTTPTPFPSRFKPAGYPTTYFIAPDGRTAFRHSGFVAWDGEKTRDFLTRLAAQPS